jgi:hypothetical protein
MPQYKVKDPTSGKTVVLTGDSPPTAAELEQIFAEINKQPEPAAAPAKGDPSHPLATVGDAVIEGAKGFGKSAARTALNLGELVHMIPGVTGAVDALYKSPGLSDTAFAEARAQTQYTNNAQRVGAVAENLLEMAVPVSKAAAAIPTTAKAGAKFQSVMGAAHSVPVDVNGPGAVALRIAELADRGGSMPMAVRKFLARITDPQKAAMTYQEARDFASNISRLSANEYGRLTPAVAREVAGLRVALNEAVAKAAQQAGKGAEYASAMKEYAQAMKIKGAIDAVAEGAKKGLPYATAAGAGTWLTLKLRQALSGE